MIGYVLLVAGAITMGIIVYQWMKTYVPSEKPECPEGISLYISEISLDGNSLTVILRNNGRFSVNGYFIRAANNSEAEIATIDISGYYGDVGKGEGGMVIFENPFSPEQTKTEVFDLSEFPGNPVFIEIIPIRMEKVENKWVTQICVNAKVKEEIN